MAYFIFLSVLPTVGLPGAEARRATALQSHDMTFSAFGVWFLSHMTRQFFSFTFTQFCITLPWPGALMDLTQLETLSTSQLLHLLWSIWFILNRRLNLVDQNSADSQTNQPSSSSAPTTYSPPPPPDPPAASSASTAAWLDPQPDWGNTPPPNSNCGQKCRWCDAWCGRHKPYHSGHSCYKHRHWR